MDANRQVFKELDETAYDLISVMSHSTNLQHIKDRYEEGGCVNMCKAIDEMIEDGRLEGLKDGKREGRREGRREGMECINTLIQHLIKDGRNDIIEKAVSDIVYQQTLLQEYGLMQGVELP